MGSTGINHVLDLVDKLEHPIADIRSRALENILSKLDRGLLNPLSFSNDEVIHNILSRLSDNSRSDSLLAVKILAIASSTKEACYYIVKHGGPAILSSMRSDGTFSSVRESIDKILHNLQKTLCRIDKPNVEIRSFSPESYTHSGGFFAYGDLSSGAETASSTINSRSKCTTLTFAGRPGNNPKVSQSQFEVDELPVIPLTEKDYIKLSDFMRSMASSSDASLPKKLHYFESVVLSDFPPEVFCQRPSPVMFLNALITTSKSSRVKIAASNCLRTMCQKIVKRVRLHFDPRSFCTATAMPVSKANNTADFFLPNDSQSSDQQQTSALGLSTGLASSVTSSSICRLPLTPLSIPAFCVSVMSSVLAGLSLSLTIQLNKFDSPSLGPQMVKLYSTAGPFLSLLNTAIDLFILCLQPATELSNDGSGLGRETVLMEFAEDMLCATSAATKDLLPTRNAVMGLEELLELWGIVLSSLGASWRDRLEMSNRQEGLCPDTYHGEPGLCYTRFMYVGLGRGLFRLVSTIWTPETCASALPNVTASELALLLLDMNMLRAAYQQPPDTPRPSNLTGDGATATPAGLAAYVRFLDPEVTLLHEELQQVGHSLEAGVTFVRNFESLKTKTGLPVENMLTLAINALNAIDFLAPEFIEKFIVFLSELPLISEAQMVAPLLTKSRQHLICLMGHPSSLVRNAAYSSLFKILKVNLSVDQAANPSGRGCERLLFLLSSEVLGELIEFGVRDPDSKITTVARDCLRLLLDGHQLMSTEIWRLFCHILTSGAASPSVAEYLLKATCWSPLLPLIVGIAPLASLEPEEGASVADVKNSRLLARRALDVCLSTGGFHVPTQPLLPADPSALCTQREDERLMNYLLPLLLPSPSVRLRASSVLAALFDARFNLILPLFDLLADSGIENARYNSNQPEYSANAITTLPSAHLVPLASINDSRSDFAAPNARSTPISEFLGLHTRTDLEHRLCDLLLFSQPPSVLVSSFVEFRTSATLLVYGREQPAEAKSSMANLVTQLYSETVNMDLRCTAGDQIFVLLQYPGGIKEWCSAGGISAFLNWFSSLPRLLLSFTDKVLIESLLKTNLAIVQCAATNDVAVRIGLLMDRNSLYNLVFVGLCYAKNDDIRHCVAHLLSLLLFNCSIRESEGSPICLPDSIVRSYCLPFTCPVYVINSRHNIQHPRLPRLSMQLALTKQVRTDDPSGHIASQVDSVNDSTRVLRDQRIPIAVCRSLRSLWARMCHGGVSQLVLSLSGSKLASRESSTPDSPFKEGHANLDQYSHFVNDAFLAFSPTDAFLLLASSPHYALYEAVDSIRSASSHLEACCGLARFLLVHAVFWRTSLSLPQEAIDGQWWKLADIQRFFKVLPACAADYQLLIQCLEAIRTADFCPPYQSASSDSRFFNRAETALWILQNLIQPHSPLAYSLLRFDAGVGLTDSQRLIQMKEELHFETLPRLFNQALELLNFSISHKNCRVDDPLNSPKSAISESESQSSETTILTAASTSTNIDEDFIVKCQPAVEFLFEWSAKFLENHSHHLLERVASVQSAMSILEQLTRNSLFSKVQLNDARLCSLFELIVDLIMRLQTQTDQHHEGFFGAAVIRTALMLLHNLLLRSASRRNRVSSALVDSSHKKWLDSPWLFHLLHYQCSEVRLFALHVLSEACLISDWLERLTSLARYFDTSHFWQPTQEPFPAGSALWGLGLRFLLNPTLSARMRCAAAHLLINLSTVLAADKLTVCYLPPDLASASSLANMFLPGITGTMTKGKQDAVGDDGSRVGQRNFLQYVSRLAQQEGDVELGDHSPSDSSIETSTSGSRAKSSVSCTERSNICDLPFFKPGRSFSLNIKRLSGPVGLSDMTCLLLSEVATMQQRQRVVESRASRASPVVSSVNGISPSSFATDGDELHFTVMDLPDRLVAPTFIESNTKLHITGLGGLACLLDSFDFFAGVINLLGSYYPYPVLSEELRRKSSFILQISRQTDDAISGHENKGRVEGVESSLTAPSSPSPPYLMSYVCRLVTSLVLLLPDLMVQRFTDLQFPQILMNIIDPELLKVLGNYSHVHRYPYLLGTHLVSAYAECLRCFRCLICLNERTKLSFLSDSRFLALVVQILSISQGNLNLESLWREQMLFFISLLEPETEDPEDLLLRHALHPLAAKATSWGGLVNRLIGRSVHLNEATLSGKTSRCLHDAERNRTFDMTRTAAIFLSVVLSRRSSRTLNALRMQGVMNGSSIQSKLQTTTSVSPDSLRASVYFDNPVPSALDKAVGRTELDEFWDLRHEDERQAARSVSGCIAISLATLTESFPQPRIGLDGCYLSSTDHRQINSEECGTPDSSVPIFGLSSAHRQAVHSALRILLCTSPMAKRAVLAVGFLDNICLLCRTLVEKLNLTLQRLPSIKSTPFLPPPPSQSSISNAAPSLTLDGRVTGIREEDRLSRCRQQAWKVLTEELVIQLELMGNLIYGSPVAKQAAVRANLPALAQKNLAPGSLRLSRDARTPLLPDQLLGRLAIRCHRSSDRGLHCKPLTVALGCKSDCLAATSFQQLLGTHCLSGQIPFYTAIQFSALLQQVQSPFPSGFRWYSHAEIFSLLELKVY
uniref:Rotatin N-terminal domain-containing protein n=2 Tax=Schistocephalus solidus TaxID=70667 RepID=A0A0X3PDP6_SCHSO